LKSIERVCPQCGQKKLFRADQKTCGCKPTAELKETNEISGDKWIITLPKTRIHTLEQLIEYFKIDLNVWEVERWIANKWEMGYKDALDVAHAEELYQVKAYLKRKIFASSIEYIQDNEKLRSQLEKARLELGSERRLAKRLTLNHAGYDDLLKNIRELSTSFGSFQFPASKLVQPKPKAIFKNGHTEDAVFVISDTHFGDVIRPEDTSGFPEYDIEIAGNRFGYVVEKAKQILAIHRTAYPISRLYVPILGDIANGILYDAPESNQLFLPAQVHFSVNMLKFAIQDLLQLVDAGTITDGITLMFSVGNHTRLDKWMPTKYQAQRTLDWLIYQTLIDLFKDDKRVQIVETMSPFIFQNIRGHRYLFCHGLQVGYKNRPEQQAKSVSQFTALVRALFDSPVYRKLSGLEGETFSRAVIGDIHVPVAFPRLLANGSLNGQNELGVNWGLEPIPAGQQLFGVSKSHIQTFSYFIDCTKVQREEPNNYATFAREYAKKFGR
jgi:hypothetical protein